MRPQVWQVLGLVFLVSWAVSCGRSTQDNEEVRALREEVKSLRAESERKKADAASSLTSTQAVVAQGTNAPTQENEGVKALREEIKSLRAELDRKNADAVSSVISTQTVVAQAINAPTPEFAEFLRVSRRIVSAMGTGVSYLDFGQRLVDVNASAEEVLPRVAERSKKATITDFVLALHDAHSLWRYKISSQRDRMRLQVIMGMYASADFPQELGDRWNLNFPDLVKKYGLRDEKNFGSPIIDYGNRPEMLFDRALERIFEYATKTFRELEKTPQ